MSKTVHINDTKKRKCRYFNKCGNIIEVPKTQDIAWCQECSDRHRRQLAEEFGEDSEEYESFFQMEESFVSEPQDPWNNL